MQEMLQRIFGILERVRNMSVDSTWVMIAFGAVLAFGLLNSILGYRLLRFWVMLFGFGAGAAAGFMGADRLGVDRPLFYFAATLGFGILVAVVAFLIYRAGIFLLGGGLAAVVSIYLIHPTSSASFFLCILIGVVIGSLALRFEKEVIIVVTSLLGGTLAGFCLAKLLRMPEFPFGAAAGGAVAILGMLIQFLINRTEEEEEPEEGGSSAEYPEEDDYYHYDPFTGEPLDTNNKEKTGRKRKNA